MTLNLIALRWHHWLMFMWLIKAYYVKRGEETLFIAKRPQFKPLARIGLEYGKDFIAIDEVPAFLEKNKDRDINMVIHHHPSTLPEWAIMVPPTVTNTLTMTLYGDGYTNRLLGGKEVAGFVAGLPHVTPRHLLFCPGFQPVGGGFLKAFKRDVLDYSLMESIFTFPRFRALAESAAADIKAFAGDRPILIAALRPWGSTTFAEGMVQFDKPEDQFVEIVLQTIAAIETEMNTEFALIIRPDLRGGEFMDNALLGLAHRLGERKFLDMNTVWPDYIAMEPLMGNLPELLGNNDFVVSSFDSTASVPFITLGIGKRHYIGSPEATVRECTGDRGAFEFLVGRMALLKKFLDELAIVGGGRATHLDGLFVRTQLMTPEEMAVFDADKANRGTAVPDVPGTIDARTL